MPLLFIPVLSLLGIGIAMYRRDPERFLDGPAEDLPQRLLRWAAGLLSAERAEWGQAMLGELGHLDGRVRRLRFALGCVAAALVLPPWGRAAAGVWAMIALTVGCAGLDVSVAVRYRLAGGDWVAAAILVVFLAGCLLGAGVLLRRPQVAVPGLLGGLVVALVSLTLSGFTFYQQIAPDIVHWHQLVTQIALPFAVGAAGTVWSRDAVTGRRIARLAAISAGLGRYLYATLAVAAVGAGGPPADEFPALRAVVSDRLGNNQVMLLLTVMVTASLGWAGAAAAARLRPAAPATPPPDLHQEA